MQLPPVTAGLDAQVQALREGAGARVLDDVAVLGLRGRDRLTWLNGMITNDVRTLAPGRSVYATVLGLKGRIVAEVFVHAREDELLLAMPADRVAEVAEHFDRYVVMEDVFASPRECAVVSVQGPRAARLAERLPGASPADRLGRGGLDVVVTDDARASVDAALAALVADGALTMVSPEAWEVARLEAGVARFGVDFDGSNFVQEAGITRRAVSFQKGCYLGQEVVCRLEMRGQVQRQLTALVVEGDAPARGDAVTAEGRDVGAVTSAATSASLPGRAVAFAMVKRAALEASQPLAVSGRAATPTLRPVP